MPWRCGRGPGRCATTPSSALGLELGRPLAVTSSARTAAALRHRRGFVTPHGGREKSYGAPPLSANRKRSIGRGGRQPSLVEEVASPRWSRRSLCDRLETHRPFAPRSPPAEDLVVPVDNPESGPPLSVPSDPIQVWASPRLRPGRPPPRRWVARSTPWPAVARRTST